MGNQFVSVFNQFIQNPSPEIEVFEPGEYVFSLSANDGSETVVKEMAVNVMTERPSSNPKTNTNSSVIEVKPPSASFSESLMVVDVGQTLNIFASADFGSAGGDTYYTWTVQGPSPATIADSKKRFSTFTAESEGSYTVSLTVGSGTLKTTETMTVLVTSDNVAPIISLPEQKDFVLFARCEGLGGIFDSDCTEKQNLGLSAPGTYDPNRDEVTYEWNLVSQPSASQLTNDDIQGRQYAYATSKINGANYYLFFAGCMFLTALGFIPYAMRYKEETFIQDESDREEG